MKKLLFCIALITMMLSSMLPSYANTTYTPNVDAYGNGKVVSSKVGGKRTVLITKGTETDAAYINNIVYINEADTTFQAATDFLINKTADDGLYTIILGGDGTIVTDKFYIGMAQVAGDVKMTRREVEDDGVTPETKNVRYLCSVSDTRSFKNVIMKINGDNFAFPLGDNGWSASGGVVLGIQIEGVDAQKVTEVWLSERTFDSNNGELKNK